ncbi:hypothetical protein A3G06_01285 [Candidatus Nomurabacteria bacterium RIFCSPLOWO2_12_FULL_46_14]|uniref:Uncharacterized protein n=1 Tax=Candidatus Nomurabacteria bacterium RIFCSPLOWO2_12_FULL_46_14 TaxID=1801797 RepID=A0A1F6Y833_9BACT|nr:MAG: hypothetical protein A3G06_01285 [Candidatus Nomurabacteria bacterium RIFCSPLOWO2_12_FULL_46_14]
MLEKLKFPIRGDERDPITPESLESDLELELVPALGKLALVAQRLEELLMKTSKTDREIKGFITPMRERLRLLALKVQIIFGLLLIPTSATIGAIEQKETSTADNSIEALQSQPKPRDEVIKGIWFTGQEYRHTDEETTHILNYMAGRDTLSEEEVVRLVKERWMTYLDTTITLPENISLRDAADSVAAHWPISRTEKLPEILLDEYNNFPRFLMPNDNLYSAIWQLEQEVGAPKVRLVNTKSGRSWYKFNSNLAGINFPHVLLDTLIITTDEQGQERTEHRHTLNPKHLLAEYAHAQQRAEDPFRSIVRKTIDDKRTQARADSLNISRYSAQLHEYSIPGTIEHEAHKIIEPQLKNRLDELMQTGKSTAFKLH